MFRCVLLLIRADFRCVLLLIRADFADSQHDGLHVGSLFSMWDSPSVLLLIGADFAHSHLLV